MWPTCPGGEFLQYSPVATGNLDHITALGNVAPPAHVFPTDHIYLYLKQDPGTGDPVTSDVVSPGDLVVSRLQASEYRGSTYIDYALTLQPCENITLVLGHVASLDEDLFGPRGDFSDWTQGDVYFSGTDSIITWYRNEVNLEVAAGQVLGSIGGPDSQAALDFGLYDLTRPAADMAGGLWTDEYYVYAQCPVEYYPAGSERDAIYALMATGEGSVPPADYCGYLHNDVAGALQGCWFLSGTIEIYPESRHVAFTPDNYNLGQAILSIGDAVATVPARDYVVVFGAEGMNDPFDEVVSDGAIHAYHPLGAGMEYYILVQLVDPDTLWIEGIEAYTPQDQWAFTAAKTVFVR